MKTAIKIFLILGIIQGAGCASMGVAAVREPAYIVFAIFGLIIVAMNVAVLVRFNKKKPSTGECIAVLILGNLIAGILLLCCSDKDWYGTASDQTHQPQLNTADELMKFKELFDSGAITQQEYEYKKQQLLGKH